MCSVPGECEATGENVLDVVSGSLSTFSFVKRHTKFHFSTCFQATDVSSEGECVDLCANTNNCTVYTYMGELNPLRFIP